MSLWSVVGYIVARAVLLRKISLFHLKVYFKAHELPAPEIFGVWNAFRLTKVR